MSVILGLLISIQSFGQNQTIVRDITQRRLDLAIKLMAAMKTSAVCDLEAYPSEINKMIRVAWPQATNLQKKNFLARIPVNSSVRQDLAFKVAIKSVEMDPYFTKVSELEKAMLNTRYFHYGMGAMGSMYNIVLGNSGLATVNKAEVTNSGEMAWKSSKVKWRLELRDDQNDHQNFILIVDNHEFAIDEAVEGIIRWVPIKGTQYENSPSTLTTSDSYCSM